MCQWRQTLSIPQIPVSVWNWTDWDLNNGPDEWLQSGQSCV